MSRRTGGTWAALLLAPGFALHAQPATHLSLADAQRLAIQNNPRFSAAKFQAAAAHQVPAQYRANLLPAFFGSVTVVGADNGSRIAAGALNNPIVFDRFGSGLWVTQLITDFGRTGNLAGAANLRAQAQDQSTEATRAQVLLDTGNAYYAALSAQAVLKVAEETVKDRQTVADQVTALAQSKLKSDLDVSFADVNLSEAKLLLVQAQNGIQGAQARLAAALGLPNLTAFVLSEEPMPAPLPARVEDAVALALGNRPELKDLRLRQSADERFAKAEHDLFYPSVGLIGTAGFAPVANAAIRDRYGAVGVNVNIPIFNGGLFRARQTEAEMKAKAAANNLADFENQVISSVRVAYLNAVTAYDRLAITQQLLQQAQMALNLAQSRYNLGLSSIVELSQAQLSLTSAQIAGVTARYDYQGRREDLDYQTGILR